MERISPATERRPLTEDELVERELAICEELEMGINHATAKVIGHQLVSGETPALKMFEMTGFIRPDLMREVEQNYVKYLDEEPMRRKVAYLSMYVAQRNSHPQGVHPPEGWDKLWLREADDDLCPCCAEHISRNHRVGCPMGVDDEDQLNRVLELQSEYGTAILHWLNYAGFRTVEELEDRARQFPEYYYGFFPDIETFRRNYEVSPDAYLEQQYEIVEGDGGVYIYDR